MDQRIGRSDMDVHTEQTYQKRIDELEAYVVSLKTQLAQRDATIAALQRMFQEPFDVSRVFTMT
jgi:hypothetical protein